MQAKYIYLLDTCAWVHYYKGDPKVKILLDHIIVQKGLNKATLFLPSFCIAEVFNTFAKWRYRGDDVKLTEDEYVKIKDIFRNHIRKGALATEYPLHIYHIYNADYVIPFEHQWDTGKDGNWRLSTFDILIIGMGIELVKHYGSLPVRILSCEKRIPLLCNKMRENINETIKNKYNIPKNLEYPVAYYLPDCTKINLPSVKGQ